ncbi:MULTISPECIES: glycosyltransferase [Gammaproteobacteria]|jgi:glycosyltransferase involved in cell wall biosynthesis|nr:MULTISPECIES: glycosyltransferase [Gammaproteobacteria]|tara:strand:- start:4503 stop:5558 length:1056 start_codon:yes stop_codon:yes gene_type:complete
MDFSKEVKILMSTDENTHFKQDAPLVSVIVPVFNRLPFLEQLFKTINAQTYSNIEVIIVDDGSTDGSNEWLISNQERLNWPTTIITQANAGHYDARNNGLNISTGKYIAFQDSDDEWPDYHIKRMVTYLEDNSDIDWLFGELKRIDHNTGVTIEESNLVRKDGSLHPFIKLNSELRDNGVNKLTSSHIGVVAIAHRVPGSTQSALIRSSLFSSMRFDPSFRTAYDQFFAVKCVLKGFQFGFVREIHQIYHVHNTNISLVNGGDADKRLKSSMTHIKGYRTLLPFCNEQESEEVRKKLAFQYAWVKAVAEMEKGNYGEAFRSNLKAISYDWKNLQYWKTMLLTPLKRVLKRV